MLRGMRIADLIIATTMLAVPASALASRARAGVRPAEQTPLNLHVTPGKVRFGARGHRHRHRSRRRRRSAAWRCRRPRRTRRPGAGSPAPPPARNGRFRVPRRAASLGPAAGGRPDRHHGACRPPVHGCRRRRRSAPGEPGRGRSRSAARFAAPDASSRAVLGGGPVHVGGRLLPALGRRVVRLQASHPPGAGARWPADAPARAAAFACATRRLPAAGSACGCCSPATGATRARPSRPGPSRSSPGPRVVVQRRRDDRLRLPRRPRRGQQVRCRAAPRSRCATAAGPSTPSSTTAARTSAGGVGPQPEHRRRARLRRAWGRSGPAR